MASANPGKKECLLPSRPSLCSAQAHPACVDLDGTYFWCGCLSCERWWARAGCGAVWNWTSFLCKWPNDYAHFLLGNCLLQRAAEAGNEAAALFLATNGAHVNHRNKWVSMTGQPGEAVVIYGRNGSDRFIGKNGIDSLFNFYLSNTCTWLKNQSDIVAFILKYWLIDSFSNHFLSICGTSGPKLHLHTQCVYVFL